MTASLLNLGPYRYRPTRQLDETRMSTLWLANEVTRESTASPGNLVIIKIARMSDTQYSLTNQRAIENEEKWLGRLEHPNIIRLRSVAEREASRQPIYRARSDLPGNPWFLVTDYLPGGDLQSFLNERKRVPASLALEIAEQLGDALAYLHARRCVHCDIKPRNILFHEQPAGYSLSDATRPIVIDFGIAKNPTDGPQLASGTPRWITPELHEALRVGRKIEVDPSWDVYAAGLVLYTMLTGRKPELDRPGSHSWTPLTPEEFTADRSVIQAAKLTAGVNQLIAAATADRAGERVQAVQFTESVRALRAHVRAPGAAPATAPVRRRVGGLWLAAAAIGIAMVLAGLLLVANSGLFDPARDGAAGGAPSVPQQQTEDAAPSSLPAAVADASTAIATVAATRTKAPTSTPIDTPTRTATPTASRTPRPTQPATATSVPTTPAMSATAQRQASRTPTPLATQPLATQPEAAAIAAMTATSTPLVGTSTPLPTPSHTPTPNVTLTPRLPAATPRMATPAGDMRVSLLMPADNVTTAGEVRFSWQPERPLGENECFEVSFWQGGQQNWQNGWGIWGANRDTVVVRRFNEEYDNETAWLEDGATYFWGVLLIEDCQAYGNRQYSPRRLVSEARRFTFDR